MGDKGGRKDKDKNRKQKASKDAERARGKKDKQPNTIPSEKSQSGT